MTNINTENQDIQQKPQNEKREKSNIILILVAVFLVLILIGLFIYIFYTFNKDTDKKNLSDSKSVTTSTLPDETENTDNEESDDPYDGWETYDGRVKLMYPEDWTLSTEEEYLLYYKVSVTSPDGYTFETWSTDGDFGVFCIFDDTDTTNMPEVYTYGIILKRDYLSYEEFRLEGENYRYAPRGEDEHTYSVCRYEDSSGFYRDYLENKFFNFILPDEEIEILKEILYSVIELN